MKEVRPDWTNISIFTPYPGTPLFDRAQKQGLIPQEPDYTLYSHQNPDHRFTDRIPQERFAILARNIFKEVHAANSSFQSLFKRALTRGYAQDPGLFLLDAKKVFSWLKK